MLIGLPKDNCFNFHFILLDIIQFLQVILLVWLEICNTRRNLSLFHRLDLGPNLFNEIPLNLKRKIWLMNKLSLRNKMSM